MKILDVNIIIFFFLLSMLEIQILGNHNKNIKAVKLTETYSLSSNSEKGVDWGNGSLDTSETSIYYHGNKTLYHVDYKYKYFSNGKENLDVSTKGSYNFVYTQGNKKGLLFDQNRGWDKLPVNADSMLKTLWCFNINIYPTIANNTMISYKKDDTLGLAKEVYKLRAKQDSTMYFYIELLYTQKLNWVAYSFSKELDSINKAKLIEGKILLSYIDTTMGKNKPDTIRFNYKMEAL